MLSSFGMGLVLLSPFHDLNLKGIQDQHIIIGVGLCLVIVGIAQYLRPSSGLALTLQIFSASALALAMVSFTVL